MKYPCPEGIPDFTAFGSPDPAAQWTRKHYNQHGWLRNENGKTRDESRYRDDDELVEFYYQAADNRTKAALPKSGTAILDAGCGANPSIWAGENCKFFFCLDFSLVGLRTICPPWSSKVFRIAAALTNLPLADSVFDAVICQHVLYHNNRYDQMLIVHELLRVTRPGGVVAIVHSDGWRAFGLGYAVKKLLLARHTGTREAKPLPFFPFCMWQLTQWQRLFNASFRVSTWRTLPAWARQRWFAPGRLPISFLRLLVWLEDAVPWWHHLAGYKLIIAERNDGPVCRTAVRP